MTMVGKVTLTVRVKVTVRVKIKVNSEVKVRLNVGLRLRFALQSRSVGTVTVGTITCRECSGADELVPGMTAWKGAIEDRW